MKCFEQVPEHQWVIMSLPCKNGGHDCPLCRLHGDYEKDGFIYHWCSVLGAEHGWKPDWRERE